jgi:hypothetical protein
MLGRSFIVSALTVGVVAQTTLTLSAAPAPSSSSAAEPETVSNYYDIPCLGICANVISGLNRCGTP